MKSDDRRQTTDDGLQRLKTRSQKSEYASRLVPRSLVVGGSTLPPSPRLRWAGHAPTFAPGATVGRSRASGSALIVVLWVIGLLSMFVMAFAFDMHVQARITSSWRKKLKAEYLSKAGVELARMMLFETTTDPDIMNNLDPSIYLAKGSDEKVRGAALSLAWGGVAEVTRELGAGTVNVTVCPVNVRNSLEDIIDVNNRENTYNMWEPLFEAAGVPWEERDALIDCLIDWVDQDEMTHLSGVESEYYESLDPPYKSKNALLDTVDELALIKGFDEKLPESDITIYEELSKYLTTYPTGNQININAAGCNEMMSIGIDEQLANEIIAQRQGPDLKDRTEDDVLFVDKTDPPLPMLPPEVLGKIAFGPAGGLYSILARGKVGDIEHAVACVMKFKDNHLTILRWIEGDALQANLISH